jgi:Asp-tRNA(Asn)/Glu-tRNA(Gln) amidotransferase A subunit family amidase
MATDGRITRRTIEEAEKLAGLSFSDAERAQIVQGAPLPLALYARRRRVTLPNELPPALRFDPRLPGTELALEERCVRSDGDPGPVPESDDDLAFAPVTRLSRWIERRALTSERLTRLALERIAKHGPALECVVTPTPERALAQARRADAELAAGRWRGPLHGIPWGAKDLLDTAGIPTTWGAAPYRDRLPERDAAVVRRLDEAGAVLVAKLALGELAQGDVWFRGRTRNPWNPAQGSGGSSAGSAAATAAGLVAFSIGSETLGSITNPSMVCGATGLRPTFGRVPRTGSMAVAWSLDKLGPICRSAEDAALVLAAIHGADPGDPASVALPFEFDATAPVHGLRVGFVRDWFASPFVTDAERAALEALRAAGLELAEFELPDLPYESVIVLLQVEAAAAFEELTLTDRDDELRQQEASAWPNTLRLARLVPAVEYVQMLRIRTRVMEVARELFERFDVLAGPGMGSTLSFLTNATGHPSLTLRAGFRDDGTPAALTLHGRLFDEGRLCRVGMALEARLGVRERRPPLG